MNQRLVILLTAAAACGGGTSAQPDAGSDGGVDAGTGSPSDPFYDPDAIVDVRLTIAPADLATLDADPFAEVYVPAAFESLGITLDPVGVRYKGNSSLARAGDKPSFKVSFDALVPEQRFLGLDTANFNNSVLDPSMQREMIAYEMFRAAGVPASRASYARLYVNGEYYGLYVNVEQVGKTFLRRRFADDDGNLYKQYAPATLEYRGPDPAAYDDGTYIKKTNEVDDDWTDLVALCQLLAADDQTVASGLPQVFDVDGFLRWLAVSTYQSHVDTYTGLANNYYLYHDPVADRFVYIPWDLDISFGTAGHGGTTTDFLLDWDIYDPRLPAPGPRPLLTRVLAVPAFRDAYTAYLRDLVDGGAIAARLADRIAAVRVLIRDAALADDRKPYSNAAFDAALDEFVDPWDGAGVPIIGIRAFVEQRTPRVQAQLP